MMRCVCDRYDRGGIFPYDDVDDFEAMCVEVFGEAPELTHRPDVLRPGWYEGNVLVLVEVSQ